MTENIQEKVEDKIIDCINSGVVGRLVIFKPEKNPLGADLAIERRGNYKDKNLFFKINSFIGPEKNNDLIEDFLQDDFKADKNFYLLFVYFDEIKQKMNDFVWLIPSLEFRDTADSVKSKDGKKSLRFEAVLDVKTKNKFSKYLVDVKELGKLILNSFEVGGKIDFKDTGFVEKKSINVERLREFISEARKNIYASNANSIDNPRLVGSVQLEFQKGDYFYRDISFTGNKKLMGQEIVYQDSRPVWGMNYLGNPIGKNENIFLKEALFKLSGKCRFGESCEHEKRELKYEDKGQGFLEDFSGQEQISSQGKNIYKLIYNGGLISDKL